MSRPWSSVPSQYVLSVDEERSPGGSFESRTSSCARSYGFGGRMIGAVMAAMTMTTSVARPASASLLSANSAANRRHGDATRGAVASADGMSVAMRTESMRRGGLAEANARVEQRVEDVDHEIDHDEDRHDDQQGGDDHGPIELVDRVDEKLAAAPPREDRLGHHGECDHRSQLEADHGHDGNEDVLQDVHADNAPRGQALRARELHVVLEQRLAGPRTGEAHEQRKLEHGEVHRRHGEGLEAVDREEAHRHSEEQRVLAAAVGRQPAELHREHHDQHKGHPERWQ